MIKKFGFYALLLSAVATLLNGCASEPTAQTGPRSTVPGESRSGEEVTPGMGPGGASANVRW